MAAEVDHRRLEFAHLAKEIQWFYRPTRLEVEAVTVAAAPEFPVDCTRLTIERKAIGLVRLAARNRITCFFAVAGRVLRP